jgi:hypothetical protein
MKNPPSRLPVQDHRGFRDRLLEPGPRWLWREEPLGRRERLPVHLRNALDELQAGSVQPGKGLADCMGGFVRVFVLIHEPGALLRSGGFCPSEIGIEKRESVSRHSEDLATDVGDCSPILVVEAHQHVALGADQPGDRLKAQQRVGRVVKHAVADGEIEGARLEARAKQVHLDEVRGP